MEIDTFPVMVITGGTGSIGREIGAQALAAGWRVVLQGRGEATVGPALDELGRGHPPGALAGFAADVRDEGAVAALVERAGSIHGRIDAVVDCLVTGPEAGGITGLFCNTNPNAYLPFAGCSLVYLQRLALVALPWLKRSRGTLITFVSDAGVFAAPNQAIIGAARAGAIGFVRNLAVEVARDEVRVHCVSLGFVADTNTARKLADKGSSRLEKAAARAGLGLPTAKDVAPLALFLCGGGARRMTGQLISINGGMNA